MSVTYKITVSEDVAEAVESEFSDDRISAALRATLQEMAEFEAKREEMRLRLGLPADE